MKKEPAEPEAARVDGRWLLLVEGLFVLLAVAGLALWSVPGALIAAGVLGVLACERASADRPAAEGQRGGEAAGGERT